MTILSAQSIRTLQPVEPFYPCQVRAHGMTYGTGPAGYDFRIKERCVMWPGRFTLASSFERFKGLPLNVIGRVCDKSSWVRRGLTVQNTVIEPNWDGWLTLEIKMIAWRFLIIPAGAPIAQVIFEWLDLPTDAPYLGKYQHQAAGPQPAILEAA